jgi:hypothetical protein
VFSINTDVATTLHIIFLPCCFCQNQDARIQYRQQCSIECILWEKCYMSEDHSDHQKSGSLRIVFRAMSIHPNLSLQPAGAFCRACQFRIELLDHCQCHLIWLSSKYFFSVSASLWKGHTNFVRALTWRLLLHVLSSWEFKHVTPKIRNVWVILKLRKSLLYRTGVVQVFDRDLLSLCYTVTRNYCKVKYHTVIH